MLCLALTVALMAGTALITIVGTGTAVHHHLHRPCRLAGLENRFLLRHYYLVTDSQVDCFQNQQNHLLLHRLRQSHHFHHFDFEDRLALHLPK